MHRSSGMVISHNVSRADRLESFQRRFRVVGKVGEVFVESECLERVDMAKARRSKVVRTHPRLRVSSPRILRTPPRGICRCRSICRTWSASNRTRVAISARRRPSPIPRVLRRESNGGGRRPAHRRRQVRRRRGGGGGGGGCSSSEASLVWVWLTASSNVGN